MRALRLLTRCRVITQEGHPYTMRITFPGTSTSQGVRNIDCVFDNDGRCPALTCKRPASERRYRRARASTRVVESSDGGRRA